MILIHLARGFEETEAITVIDVLRRADLDAHFVSLGVFRQVIGAHGIMIEADYRYEEVDYGCCDMIVLPGGLEGAKALSVHKGVRKQLLTFAREGKGLAAICAAPGVLGGLGILKGKKAVCYPGVEDKLTGAEVLFEEVVQDGCVTTSRGMGTAIPFALHLVSQLVSPEKAEELKKSIIYQQ